MKKILSMSVLFLNMSLCLLAQSTGIENAIERFKNTDLMIKYKSFKSQIEDEAQDFIAEQANYDRKDVRKLQLGYDKSAARFNQIMLDIKYDFLDKKKVKTINEFPQMYSDGLMNKLNEAERYCKENFQLPLAEITEKNNSAILALLFELITKSGELSGFFKNMKYEKQSIAEAYIQKNLIEPMRIQSWSDLESITTVNPANKKPKKQEDETKNSDIQRDKEDKGNKNEETEENTETTKNETVKEVNEKKVETDSKSTIKAPNTAKSKTVRATNTSKQKNNQ